MWLDTGTVESMMSAAEFVQSFQDLSGQLIGSPEEVAWRNGWISSDQLRASGRLFQNSYGTAIQRLAAD
jgi:glucose-1-phosphate thymidylyltransferase